MRRGVEAGLLGTAAVVVLAGGVSAAQQVTEPLLRIGLLDGPPEYPFSQVTVVQQLPGGQVLVVDVEVPAVPIFDAEGRYLQSLGRRGDGPGEFQRPLSATLRDDGIRIFDHGLQRVVHFDLEGTHLGTRRLPEHAWRIRDPQPVRGGWRVARQGGSFSMNHARTLVSGAGDAREAGAGVVHMVVFDDVRIDTVATGQTGWVYGYDSDGATMVNSVSGELGNPILWTVGGDSLVMVMDGTVGEGDASGLRSL